MDYRQFDEVLESRERRLAFAWMTIDGRYNLKEKLRQPKLRNPWGFYLFLASVVSIGVFFAL